MIFWTEELETSSESCSSICASFLRVCWLSTRQKSSSRAAQNFLVWLFVSTFICFVSTGAEVIFLAFPLTFLSFCFATLAYSRIFYSFCLCLLKIWSCFQHLRISISFLHFLGYVLPTFYCQLCLLMLFWGYYQYSNRFSIVFCHLFHSFFCVNCLLASPKVFLLGLPNLYSFVLEKLSFEHFLDLNTSPLMLQYHFPCSLLLTNSQFHALFYYLACQCSFVAEACQDFSETMSSKHLKFLCLSNSFVLPQQLRLKILDHLT